MAALRDRAAGGEWGAVTTDAPTTGTVLLRAAEAIERRDRIDPAVDAAAGLAEPAVGRGRARTVLGVGRRVAAVVGRGFGAVAALRRAPAVHPEGSLHRATVTVDAGDHPLARLAGDHAATVRLSRGAGLPARLPDVLGLAVRLEDQPLDLLLASSGRGRLTRHLLVAGRGPGAVHYSSLAPYVDDAGHRFVVGARPAPGRDATRVDLEVAAPGGPWQPMGRVVLDAPVDAHDRGALGFDPWRTPAWVRPAGLVNALRRPAYSFSRAGRTSRAT